MAERLKAPVLKTGDRVTPIRGFESCSFPHYGCLAERLKAPAWKAGVRRKSYREFESPSIRQYGVWYWAGVQLGFETRWCAQALVDQDHPAPPFRLPSSDSLW